MVLFKKSEDLSKWIETQRRLTPSEQFFSMGFVPTMGALHQGHISLIEASKAENDLTVCSIFVNPTQFNDTKDFEKYPATIETDIEKLEAAGCDVLFLPAVSEIYPQGTQLLKHYNLGFLETVLDGKFRPGHFQGVCQVVERLLQIVKPTQLYLGQ
ncbi:MAG TPA: pantoate--beta-alanine ligase, partial [Chitinophagaceae bacterium]|nr:pantoate--beta-alanine ligase [Chitinophagaceae bacterium]